MAFVVTAVVGLVIADIYDRVTGKTAPPPPKVNKQLRSIQGRLERHFRLIELTSAQLQATGPKSHVFLLRPRVDEGDQPRSDEIQIYDENEDGHLERTWRFAARPTQRSAPDAPLTATRPTHFVIRERSFRIRDFDATPGDELTFGLYEVADRRPRFPRPVLVRWEPADREYAIDPLLSSETVSRVELRNTIVAQYLNEGLYARLLVSRVYTRPEPIADVYRAKVPAAYAVEVFRALPRTAESPLDLAEGHIELAAGYIVDSRGIGTAERLQIVRWDIRITPDGGPITASPVPDRVVRVGPNSGRLDVVLRRVVRD